MENLGRGKKPGLLINPGFWKKRLTQNIMKMPPQKKKGKISPKLPVLV